MKIDRLLAIVMILLERRQATAKYLSEIFNVSLRTIYRDVEAINAAGIPIVASPGIGGGFHLMDEYKVDKKLFTDSDIVTILMGLGSISSTLNTNEITNALSKVKSLIPENKSNDIDLKSNQVVVDLQPWMGNTSIPKIIKQINTAISSRNIVCFNYVDKYGKQTSRIAEPHRLILKDNNWYLHGFCHNKNDFRIFKVSRMHHLESKNEQFSTRIIPDLVSMFTQEIKNTQYDIKMIIHKSIIDSVLNYCDINRMTEYSPEHYMVMLPFIADDIGYGILLSFGDKCECLEPEHVRNEMAKRSLAIAKLYTSPVDFT